MCNRRNLKNRSSDKILSLINRKYGCMVEACKRGNLAALKYYLDTGGGDPNMVNGACFIGWSRARAKRALRSTSMQWLWASMRTLKSARLQTKRYI
jgi:hypothetical protein